jgi:hypothetical protein
MNAARPAPPAGPPGRLSHPNPEAIPMPHWLRISLGLTMLVLGVAGLFLPILQGILFLVIALGLLSPYSPFLKRQEAALKRRFPAVELRRQELTARCAAWWRKTVGVRLG